MLDEKDIDFIQELIKDRIKEYKNKIAGTKHFMGYKLKVGETESIINSDKKEIQELEEKIEYANSLIRKLEVRKWMYWKVDY